MRVIMYVRTVPGRSPLQIGVYVITLAEVYCDCKNIVCVQNRCYISYYVLFTCSNKVSFPIQTQPRWPYPPWAIEMQKNGMFT